MILLGSRYADGDIKYVLNPRTGTPAATVFRSNDYTVPTGPARLYYWRDGDRLDRLAEQMYGSSDEWWRILDANPEVVNPTALEPGMALRVPRLT